MYDFNPPHLRSLLEHQVQLRTGRRVRNLAVELHPGRVVLRGEATTFYVKQLAQHSVRDLLPDILLDNSIVVDGRRRAYAEADQN